MPLYSNKSNKKWVDFQIGDCLEFYFLQNMLFDFSSYSSFTTLDANFVCDIYKNILTCKNRRFHLYFVKQLNHPF